MGKACTCRKAALQMQSLSRPQQVSTQLTKQGLDSGCGPLYWPTNIYLEVSLPRNMICFAPVPPRPGGMVT